MSPVQAVRSALRGYRDFAGRARRSEFWWFYLATAVVVSLAVAVDIGGLGSSWDSYGPLEVVTQLVLLLPTAAVTVRRLHDTARTGWWFVVWLAIYLLGEGLHLLDPAPTAGQIVVAIVDIAGFAATVVMLVFLVQRTRGPNRYGAPPDVDEDASARTT